MQLYYGTVEKVNNETYTVKFDDGDTHYMHKNEQTLVNNYCNNIGIVQ